MSFESSLRTSQEPPLCADWASAYFRRPLTDPTIRNLTREQILLHDDMRRKLDRIKAGLSPETDADNAESFDPNFSDWAGADNQPTITMSAKPDVIDLTDDSKWKDI